MFTFSQLRAEAVSLGHAAESEVFRFIDALEGKTQRLEECKALLIAAGYGVSDPANTEAAAPV